MRLGTLFALAGVVLLGVLLPTASGSVLVDRFSNHALWENTGIPFATGHGRSRDVYANGPAGFVGNGEQISTIGFGFSFWGYNPSSGSIQYNYGDLSLVRWRFALYQDPTDFAADPYALNRPSGSYMDFTHPSNSDWMTVQGHTGALDVRFVNFDVSSLNMVLPAGDSLLACVIPIANDHPNTAFHCMIALSNAGGIGVGPDWYMSDFSGPATYQDLNAPRPFGSWQIITTPVPAPASVVVVFAAASIVIRRKR